MRRSTLLLPLLLLLLTPGGCSGLLAESPRLAPGEPGMVSARYAEVFHESGRAWRASDAEFDDIFAREGDRLVVLEDAGDVLDPDRRVRVRMETGAKAGRVYLLGRRDVRPVSTPPR